MKEIYIGTSNKGKIEKLRQAFSGLKLKVLEPKVKVEVREDGSDVVENAVKKARAYADKIGKPVLSLDSALYIEGLDDERQPGTKIRRIKGGRKLVSDQELLEYYSELVEGLGGESVGKVVDGVCIAKPNGEIFTLKIVSKRKMVSKPSEKKVENMPLDSLQIDSRTGKYYSQLSEKEKSEMWGEVIGKELKKFVLKTLPEL